MPDASRQQATLGNVDRLELFQLGAAGLGGAALGLLGGSVASAEPGADATSTSCLAPTKAAMREIESSMRRALEPMTDDYDTMKARLDAQHARSAKLIQRPGMFVRVKPNAKSRGNIVGPREYALAITRILEQHEETTVQAARRLPCWKAALIGVGLIAAAACTGNAFLIGLAYVIAMAIMSNNGCV